MRSAGWGVPSPTSGRVSTDRFGARLAGLLAEDGVRLDAHVRTDDPTTLALVELDDRGAAAYRFYTEGTAAAGLTPEAALAALPADAAYLHVGTLGLVLEPMADALEALVEALAGRALVMTRPELPAGDHRRRAALPRAARPRAARHATWSRSPTTTSRGWRRACRRRPRRGRCSPRGRGSCCSPAAATGATGAGPTTVEIAVAAPPVDVVDTIGAGDAFSGGWLAWWAERGLGRDDLGDRDAVAEATALRLPRRRAHVRARGRRTRRPATSRLA